MTELTIKRPLWIKISGYGFAAVLFASAAIGGMGWYAQANMSSDALQTKVSGDIALIHSDMDGLQRAAAAIAVQLANDPEIAGLVEKGDRDAILKKYSAGVAELKQKFSLPLSTVFDASGTAIARAHNPSKFGDNVLSRRKTVQTAIASGDMAAGIEIGQSGDIGLYAVAPIKDNGKVVGAVDIGTNLSAAYFNPLGEKLGSEIAVDVMVNGKLTTQASTRDGKSMLPDEDLTAGFNGKDVLRQIEIGDRDVAVKVTPFKNFSGETIGVFEIGANATKIVDANNTALWRTLMGTAVICLLTLVGFMVFARSLGGAIGRLTGTMSKLASGDLSATVEGGNRPDEIGAMAKAVDVFKDNALKTQALERDAEEQRNLTDEQRRRNAEQERIRAEAMAEATNGLATGLKHLSAGDLTFQLNHAFAQEFESLRADFNATVGQLRGTLGSVAQATSAIDSGSREVSQSADDLSKRTEQQAASLEETAAALDQITVNVGNSSKRADEARKVAIQANESARQSGAVVANAVNAMGRIEESSGQISSIIGVIDDIAFQTNLLALNAGVEAARAGEAGKGFAVVAQEVRELAQRSAQAAKEIKDLIGKSSVEVETGVKLVSDTGAALKTIEDYIVTINQHMDSIATSSREQSVGLAEVNTAVNQMDQVTQQNAAMVEEANAAGATLATEAGRLRELVSQFQLGQFQQNGGEGYRPAAQSAALRQTASAMAAPVRSASTRSAPVASPARGMVGKLAQAFGGGKAAAAAPSADNWEEF
ncbi:methyl-accepting chemotaxis protein [Neorhizobium sp. NCHU2750]|uniref:methyl-accepting chemotaxis protein n=1 Tax=Neorhizobium sp. NCHU2750 TaxID=1825976 RepID=UPI000E75F71F|nr:methyl-accepting chemotaxis protein [Neorhizobium sp. NCHU2750]